MPVSVECRHVLICADMCRYVPTCETTLSTSDTNHLNLILYAGMCQHIWACRHVLICADMCQHVPTCDINHDTSYSDHLNLIYMLACVSTCPHPDMPTYAGMCQHVNPLLVPLTSDTNHLNLIFHAGTCQHIWTCRHVLLCAGMC